MLGNFALGFVFVPFIVLMDVLGADAADANGELRIAGREHQRVQAVRNKVPEQTGAIAIIFAPAMELLGAEIVTGFHWAEPAFPINIGRRGFLFDLVIPFTAGVVAAIIALGPDEGADFAALDELCDFVPAGSGATLGADLENLASPLDRVVNLEGFIQVTRHGLFAIDVFAGFERINGDPSVPRVVSGDENGIEVFAFEKFAVIGVDISVFEFRGLLGPIATLVVKVAGGGNDDVIVAGVLMKALEMIFADAIANADDRHGDAVVGANDTAGRRRLILAVNGGFEQGG